MTFRSPSSIRRAKADDRGGSAAVLGRSQQAIGTPAKPCDEARQSAARDHHKTGGWLDATWVKQTYTMRDASLSDGRRPFGVS